MLLSSFNPGLEDNDFCVWVVSEPLSEREVFPISRWALCLIDSLAARRVRTRLDQIASIRLGILSALVKELHKPLVPPGDLLASSTFDQYKRDIPYITLVQAFQSLIRPS